MTHCSVEIQFASTMAWTGKLTGFCEAIFLRFQKILCWVLNFFDYSSQFQPQGTLNIVDFHVEWKLNLFLHNTQLLRSFRLGPLFSFKDQSTSLVAVRIYEGHVILMRYFIKKQTFFQFFCSFTFVSGFWY